MGMINKVSDTLSNVSKDMLDKVKSGNDATKLKQQIVYEEEKIAEDYISLGKSHYANRNSLMTEEELKLCDDINARIARVARLNIQINDIKGIKVCPQCGVSISNNFVFCGLCGAKLPDSIAEVTNEVSSLAPKKALV